MGKRIVWTELARADIRAVEQPTAMQDPARLWADTPSRANFAALDRPPRANHRVVFRDYDDHFQIERVLDRKEAYR